MFKIAVAFLLMLTCVSGVGTANDDEFYVDFYCGWDGYYRPMEWTPIEIGIDSDLTEPFGGTFIASAPQDGLNTLNVARPFVLTPERTESLPLVTKFAFGMGRCDLEIRDHRGRLQWEQTVDLWDFTAESRVLSTVRETDMLLGVIGQSRFGLLRVPRDTVCFSARGEGNVYVGRKVPQVVPWDWTGFVSLDVLVVYDPDWALLRSEQVQAITEWVSNGGTLMLILGRHPLPPGNPLARMIPFDVGEPRQTEVPPEVLDRWGLKVGGSETVTSWPLFAKPDARLIDSTKAGEAGYLHGVGRVGFGRVAVLAFDPAGLPPAHADHAANFWTAHVRLCLGDTLEAPGGRAPSDLGRLASVNSHGRTIALAPEGEEDERESRRREQWYRISIAQQASNDVMEHLYRLAEMRPLSIWWVILTLVTLAFILGPFDYLVLKRLDRLPYTWLTSTMWIVLFTFGAYYGVQALRGGNMQLRAVSVLDGIADSDCAWSTCYAGVYSPRSADYELEGLGARQWWSGIAPSQEQMWAHQQQSALRQISCLQEDGANLPISLPINIWTVQSLLTESPLDSMPFTASVTRTNEGFTVEVENRSDTPIRVGCVLLEDAYLHLGPVPPRSTQQFDGRTHPFNPWGTDRIRPNRGRGPEEIVSRPVPRYPGMLWEEARNAFLAQGCFDRTLAMHAYLDLGAALVCVEFEEAPAPFGVKDRSYEVNHIQLARQIVFPKDGI
ncbi:MAG: DUF4350 domain-containing protein [Phycisphaerales bacterium]|nr:MAG: DUF4350 domain-containing protein [Phycisphaerales bacterium]